MRLKLNTEVYPLEAIIKSAGFFRDSAYIFIAKSGKTVNVTITSKKKLSPQRLKSLHDEFINELLHFSLRSLVSKNNKKIREYIVGRALYSALPASDLIMSSKKLNYQDDPLKIAVPWEDKYKCRGKRPVLGSKSK